MQHLEQLAYDLDHAGQDLLAQSRFFSALSEGNLEVPAIRNVLKRYAPFRDSFHTLWGHIIARSPSAADPIAMEIVLSLCRHVQEELRDDHTGMYRQFLRDVGVDAGHEVVPPPRAVVDDLARWTSSSSSSPFAELTAGLAGRELLASARNRRLMTGLDRAGLDAGAKSPWLVLHSELEIDHFTWLVSPLMETTAITEVKRASLTEMKAHVCLWDQRFSEVVDASEAH